MGPVRENHTFKESFQLIFKKPADIDNNFEI